MTVVGSRFVVRYLDLGDYLVYAEDVLGIPAEHLAGSPRMGGAQSALFAPQVVLFGEEQYPDLAQKAGVLCARLIQNHPLPDGNKRVALLVAIEFIERNGLEFVFDEDEAFEIIVGVAAGEISEERLIEWFEAGILERSS